MHTALVQIHEHIYRNKFLHRGMYMGMRLRRCTETCPHVPTHVHTGIHMWLKVPQLCKHPQSPHLFTCILCPHFGHLAHLLALLMTPSWSSQPHSYEQEQA